ncbi:MAG: class I SAM-dependent rRNA methyltransferase [Deltaproteobacteria bacterium]|nr:class I SAM-dependent rRNA methyltransferase [Deltaproteobacteria bacterium]
MTTRTPTLPLPTVRLRRDLARAVRRGHPWLYAEALAAPRGLSAGTVVEVLDPAGRFLARGTWDPDSPIAVRVLTLDAAQPVDEALVADRVAAAAARRAPLLASGDTDCCRLVHGEADRLPGVVCDRYGDAAVLRFDGAGPAALRGWVVEAMRGLPGLARVLERPFGRATSRRARPGPDGAVPAERPAVVLAGGAPAGPREVLEHGLRFEVDLLRGHKTGLYLDQRENRARVRELAAGRRVLNLFAYTGGFAVAAAAGGARASVSVELARPAAAAARRNLARNGADPAAHVVEEEDAFAWLARAAAARRSFDLLVCDPPSFAPNRASVPRARTAYRRLNAAVLRLAGPGALVLSCSCSSHIDERAFLGLLRAAAADARRRIAIREVRGAGDDHPVARWFPEGRYLKAVLLHLDR